jgi:hypothetical protein
MSNHKKINQNIFKYGDEPKVITFSNTSRSNSLFDIDLNESIKIYVNRRVVNEFTENINTYLNETFIANNISYISNNITIDIPKNLEVLSLSLFNDGTQDRVFMNNNYHFTSTIFMGNNTEFSNINNFSQYSFVSNRKIYINNDIDIKNNVISVNNDNQLYYNNIRLLNFEDEEIYNNITGWSLDDNNNSYTFGNVAINSSNNNDYNLYVNGDTKTDNLTIVDSIYFNNNQLNIYNNDLYYNNIRLLNFEDEEIYNNITGWSLDDNNNSYTFGNVAINSSNNNDYNLYINGDTKTDNLTVVDSIYFNDASNQLHIYNNDLYFNNCKLNICVEANVIFYLSFDYDTTILNDLTNIITSSLLSIDSTIDFTYIIFTFSESSIKVILSPQIGITDIQTSYTYEQLRKINLIISNDLLFITYNGITHQAYKNIYLYNEYYFFPQLSRSNSFTLVKRSNELITTSILNGHQVYLKNLDNQYLQKNYTFSNNLDNRLLLEVRAYKNNFITPNTDEIIYIKDGFKLQTLPPIVVPPGESSIIIGDEYIDNITDFEQDTTWQNPGINPAILTEEVFLSENIEDYITNPALYNILYLVDERWLTYTEDSSNNPIYSYTTDDDNDNSKKFIYGVEYDSIIIADYVFEKNYKLESIEEHGDFMYKNKHLPAVMSNKEYLSVFKDKRIEQILEELEKAHIYIYMLNEKIKKLENN